MPVTGGAGGMGGWGGSLLDGRGSGGTVADGNVTGAGGSSLCWPSTVPDDAGWLCGSVSRSTTRRQTDVLLVLDRSGSMHKSLAEDCLCVAVTGDEGGSLCATTNCADRWTSVKSAVGQIIADTSEIDWGVELFPTPGGSGCSVSSIPSLPVTTDGGAPVQGQLDGIAPGGNTPTAEAIRAATAYLSALADQNKKVILLVTDGEPNCAAGDPSANSSDLDATIAAITAAYGAGFPVYVVGIGPSTGNLNSMAKAGGTESFHPATSPEQLLMDLLAISRIVASCTFVLPGAPPDPGNIAVYLDKQRVEEDPVNGWTYGVTTSTIVFNGTYCDRLVSALDITVQVLFGCSSSTRPPACIP